MVRTRVSDEVFAFPPLPPVVFEDMFGCGWMGWGESRCKVAWWCSSSGRCNLDVCLPRAWQRHLTPLHRKACHT